MLLLPCLLIMPASLRHQAMLSSSTIECLSPCVSSSPKAVLPLVVHYYAMQLHASTHYQRFLSLAIGVSALFGQQEIGNSAESLWLGSAVSGLRCVR